MRSVQRRARGRTQHQRLLDAMIDLCAEVGYPEITVASLSARAGVSTASFYECFASREECLVAACRAAARRIFGERPAGALRGRSDPLRFVLSEVLLACQRDPQASRLLFVGALAARSTARRERARAFAEFERTLEPILGDAGVLRGALDLPPAAITGALSALLATHGPLGVDLPVAVLLEDMLAWAHRFAIGAGDACPGVGPDMALSPAEERALGPPPAACADGSHRLPRGRHRLPSGLVARVQRRRLIHGLAEATLARGYEDLTVTDIVAAAGVARGVFYRHFASKHDAFLAAQQFGSTELLRELARAYFHEATWPERVWCALDALGGFIAANAALAHIRLVDCYAAGQGAAREAERARSAATIFLFEGFEPATAPPGRTGRLADASVGAIFEFLQRDLLTGEIAILRRRLPQLTYLAITPALGASQARRVVNDLTSATLAASG